MVKKKTWEEFRRSGMLWFANMILHVFGWAICIEMEKGEIIDIFPARVRYRGFGEKYNSEGYKRVSEYMKAHANELVEEAKD